MQDNDNKQFTASHFRAITEEARRNKSYWYRNRIEEYMRRHLQYQIRAAAEKGYNELAIDIKAVCRWIKNGIPDSVAFDTKVTYARLDKDCIDDAIRSCFYNYLKEVGFSFGYIDDSFKQECIRW
jgi:hypothetical protein